MRRRGEHQGGELQRADPAARATALGILAVVVVLGVLAFVASTQFEREIVDWARDAAQGMESPIQFLMIALFIVMLPMVAISVWVFREGAKMVRAQRIPYPGQKVIKDTPVVTGAEAIKRGRAIQIIAVLMGAVSLAVPFVPPLVMLFTNQGT